MIKNTSKIKKKDLQITDSQWKLASENMKLVDIMLDFFKKKYPATKEDLDEYRAAGMEALIQSARKYEEGREATFSTYALTSIRRSMIRVHSSFVKRKKRFKSRDWSSGDNVNYESGNKEVNSSTKGNILDGIIGEEQLSILKTIIAEAPQMHREVIEMRFNKDLTFQDIGEFYGVTRESARTYLKDAINYVTTELEKANG